MESNPDPAAFMVLALNLVLLCHEKFFTYILLHMVFCNYYADATLIKNSRVALGQSKNYLWQHYSWHQYWFAIKYYCKFQPKEKSIEPNLDTQKTPKKKKSLKQTNEENAQRYEIKGQGKQLTFPCDQFGSKHKISLTYIPRVNLHQFRLAAQSCPAVWDPMDRSTPGLPVHHQLPEFTQTQVHWVSDAIQPSHPLSAPSPPAFNLSQHQGLFKWVSSSHQVAKVLEFQLQHQSFQWIFRTDFL